MGKRENIYSLIYGDKVKTLKWSLSNDLVCLVQGNEFFVNVTDTIYFIPWSEIPQGRDIMFASSICGYRPLKYEPC